MTTKTLIIGSIALAGAWLVFGSRSSGAAGDLGAAKLGTTASGGGRLPPINPATSATASRNAAVSPRSKVLLAAGSPSVIDARNPIIKPPSSLDGNRVTSGVTNLGAIGTDGPFRGI